MNGQTCSSLRHRPQRPGPNAGPRLSLRRRNQIVSNQMVPAAQASAAGNIICKENCLRVWGMKLEST